MNENSSRFGSSSDCFTGKSPKSVALEADSDSEGTQVQGSVSSQSGKKTVTVKSPAEATEEWYATDHPGRSWLLMVSMTCLAFVMIHFLERALNSDPNELETAPSAAVAQLEGASVSETPELTKTAKTPTSATEMGTVGSGTSAGPKMESPVKESGRKTLSFSKEQSWPKDRRTAQVTSEQRAQARETCETSQRNVPQNDFQR